MRRKIAATIGVFDGVHRGHQVILKKLVKEAASLKTKSLVITFHPHPRKFLTPDSKIPFLISLQHRLKLIKDMGIDSFFIVKFTKAISKIKPDVFIKKILVDKFAIKAIVVGENFLFGYKGKGNFRLLKNAGKRYGFRVVGVKSVKMKDAFISSTRIRHAVKKGNFRNASLMLGRPVTVLGTVIEGRGVGRKLGFPTANINPHHEAIPHSGVYAVNVRIHRKIYKGILNIGTRPTFTKDKDPVMELHILDFKRDLYGKDIEIIFKKKIRSEKKFHSVKALRLQIQKDILSSI